jgi:phenylalanine-4-hydroxylase
MPQLLSSAGLTTGDAPFIEEARSHGQLYIQQPYQLYTEENHETWRKLYGRMRPQWERYAHPNFLQGLASLALDPDHIPRLTDVNRHLRPLTGFQAKAVSGYVPAFLFFDCLRNRQFPTTITIRRFDHLDYLPEPDIFHDAAGHIPMHTDRHFADSLVRFGECAHTAAALISQIGDESRRIRVLTNMLRAMARFFWFTVEFGLMRSPGGVKAYGSGLLSSCGELQRAVQSSEVHRYPFQLEWVIHQSFRIDCYQPLLFIVDSFDHLFSLLGRLEHWMTSGRLDNIAPGEPDVNEADLKSFLVHAGA